MSKPTQIELEIAIRSEQAFHNCAAIAPAGSLTEQHALRERDAATKEVQRLRTGILEYQAAMEAAVMSYRGDRRRQ